MKLLKFKSVTVLFALLLLTSVTCSLILYSVKNIPANIRTETSLHYLEKTLTLDARDDSWHPMSYAINKFNTTKTDSLYSTVFIEDDIKFQYPPTSLLIFDIPNKVFNLSYHKLGIIYNKLSFVAIFFIALLSIKIFYLTTKKLNITFENKKELYLNSLMIFFLCYLFYPLTRSFHLGQIQTALTLFTTLSLLFYLENKDKLSGICIGLVCLIKPHLGILLVWALLRKKWAFLTSSLAVILFFGIISLIHFGINNHLDYLDILSFLSKHGESYYPNQSINGLLNRFFFNGNNLVWNGSTFPPFSLSIYLPTLISSLLFISFALYKKGKSVNGHIIDFSIMILSIIISSPIAWEHHYSILFPIFIGIIVPYSINKPETKPRLYLTFLSLNIVYVCASQNLSILNYFAENKLNILQSYLFFSAFFILIILYEILFNLKKNLLIENNNSIN